MWTWTGQWPGSEVKPPVCLVYLVKERDKLILMMVSDKNGAPKCAFLFLSPCREE